MSEIQHGTLSGYTHHHCDCLRCLQVGREYHAAWRAARRGNAPDGLHGRPSTYTNWGCRCDPCREAMVEYLRDYRRRKALERAS